MTQEESVRRLAEIRERADKATPGPWECEHEDYVSSVYLGSANAGSYPAQRAPIHRDTDITDRQADEARSTVEFIAHSREDVPYLLSLIDSLTAERDQLRLMLDTEYRVAAIESGLLARAEAAEAERDNAREQLRLANIDAVNTATELQAAEADRERMQVLLGRVLANFKRALAGTPVRDADETIAEAEAALATPPSEGGTR